MLAPTLVLLGELTGFPRVLDVLAASGERSLTPVQPELVRTVDGLAAIRLPDGRLFPRAAAGP